MVRPDVPIPSHHNSASANSIPLPQGAGRRIEQLDRELKADATTSQLDGATFVTCATKALETLPENGELGTSKISKLDTASEKQRWESGGSVDCFVELSSGAGLEQSERVAGEVRLAVISRGGGTNVELGSLTFDVPYCGEYDAKMLGGN